MENARRTARLLASVTNETEALLCAHLAADIIDAKNPAAGALGALPHATVKAIRARVPRHTTACEWAPLCHIMTEEANHPSRSCVERPTMTTTPRHA